MATTAIVRIWRDDEGCGVVDSPETPGGCWVHFSHLAMTGYRGLRAGDRVELEWESAAQDGYAFRAIRAWHHGAAPVDRGADPQVPRAYRSTLTIAADSDAGPADPV